ncbi:hypothetical protein AG1IA_03583 [Rhizoctonia solani AG-1 IA]|uniref:Uncharacterized protein n=1 Tax=Thanatephorus cucumeris (strain AG1-IA) TaxID=983506 RepID=L8X1B6_THACA|nr:hypothetical protein AG1IA_03583 [Rhizoctonia solani AG-1 IA]
MSGRLSRQHLILNRQLKTIFTSPQIPMAVHFGFSDRVDWPMNRNSATEVDLRIPCDQQGSSGVLSSCRVPTAIAIGPLVTPELAAPTM